MLSTQVVKFLLLFSLQFSIYGATLAVGEADQKEFKLPGGEKNAMNHPTLDVQKAMNAAFANILGNSPAQDAPNWFDGQIPGCIERQNFTMHVGNLSVVYTAGVVRALPDTEPTIWTLSSHPSSGPPAWGITHWTPWGKAVYWGTDGYRVTTSNWDMTRLNIKYAPGTPSSPRIIIWTDNGRCVRFDQAGTALLEDNSYCQPISIQITRPIEWRDAAKKEECASTQLRRLAKKVEDEVKDGNNVHTAGLLDKICGWGNKAVDSIGCALGFEKACVAADMWRPDC